MTYEEYLQHHGIAGMRWGRRNGPPYPLLRRNMSSAERKENPATGNSSQETVKSQKPEKQVNVQTESGVRTNPGAKGVKQMTNEELKDSLNRMENEKKYREYAQKDISDPKNFIKNILIGMGAIGITTIAFGVAEKGGKWVLDKMSSKQKEDASNKMLTKLEKEFVDKEGNFNLDSAKNEKSRLEILKNIAKLRTDFTGKDDGKKKN